MRRRHRGWLIGLDELVKRLARERARYGARVAFTNGCFDVLHMGHIALLRECSHRADVVVVGLNSDGSVRRLKGDGRPVNLEGDRAMLLCELASVDFVVVFNEDTPLQVIVSVLPDVLVKGADYGEGEVVGEDVVRAHGGDVKRFPLVEGLSTSVILGGR